MAGNPVISIEDKAAFVDLVDSLSPENLTCDGELTDAQVLAHRREIDREWTVLEQKNRVRVSQHEAEDWWPEVQAWERQKAQAEREALIEEVGSDPRLTMRGLGQWLRTANDRTGYDSSYVITKTHGQMEFLVTSALAGRLTGTCEIGRFPSLGEAANAGDAFLRTVTAEKLSQRYPTWRQEAIAHWISMVPVDLRSNR